MKCKPQHRSQGERGVVMILTLIVMGFGAVTIPPFLDYVSTSMKSAGVAKEALRYQYAADAAVEESQWRLANNVDGIVDNLSLSNPSYNFSVTTNAIEVPYTVGIALFKDVDTGQTPELPPLPPTQSGNHIEAFLNVTPKWMSCGLENVLIYDVYLRNYGTSNVGINELVQALPPSADYVSGSFLGPNALLTETWVTDHWEVLWDFTNPKPRIRSGETLMVSFRIKVYVGVGSYNDFGAGWIYY